MEILSGRLRGWVLCAGAITPAFFGFILVACPNDSSSGAEGQTPAALSQNATSAKPTLTIATTEPTPSGWPRVVVVPDPGLVVNDPVDHEDDAGAIDLSGDLENEDAAVQADASHVDARPDVRPDTPDNAPLMGTQIMPGESEIKGIRRVTSPAAIARKAPRNGAPIATLRKGTDVTLVAEVNNWFRVKFTEPGSGLRRQGWVHNVNFAGPRVSSCPVNWNFHPFEGGGGGWCDKDCKRNVDCRGMKGYKCSGALCFFAAD